MQSPGTASISQETRMSGFVMLLSLGKRIEGSLWAVPVSHLGILQSTFPEIHGPTHDTGSPRVVHFGPR